MIEFTNHFLQVKKNGKKYGNVFKRSDKKNTYKY